MFTYSGQIECDISEEINSYSVYYTDNYVGEVMYTEITIWGPEHHVCHSLHNNLMMIMSEENGNVIEREYFKREDKENVF